MPNQIPRSRLNWNLHGVALTVVAMSVIANGICTAGELDLNDNDIPIVLTPTRLKQSLADVPGSVTVITADMIQKFNIRSIPDALRFVPGMSVDQVTSSDYRINYHGANMLTPRRMNVLIDGISVYQPLLAYVAWEQLPVVMEDILRIEVTRGPNSASYGPNSMLAIINIITKQPREAAGTMLSSTVGSHGTRQYTARYGGIASETTSYRMTIDSQKDSGIGDPYNPPPEHNGIQFSHLNIRAMTEISKSETLDTQIAVVQGVAQLGGAAPYQTTFPDLHRQEYYLSSLWRNNISADHALQIQAYASQSIVKQEWRACVPAYALLPEMYALWRANKSYVYALFAGQMPSGGTAQDDALALAAINALNALGSGLLSLICANANGNYTEQRMDAEFQDTYVFSNTLRMVNGFGMRQDKTDSQPFVGGIATNNSFRAFNSTEYKPVDWATLNIGGYFEKDQLTGSTFSPRIAANLHASNNHSFRFVVSKATRSPDIYEQVGRISYHLTNYSTPLNGATEGNYMFSSQASGNLGRERILSKEIGYNGNFPQYGLFVDGKIFDDHLTHLISQIPTVYSFDLTNQNSVRLRGTEWQINYEPTPRWMTYFGYSYLLNTDATDPMEHFQYSKHSGSLGITHLLDDGIRVSASITGAYDTLGGAFATRKDLTLSKSFAIYQKSRLTAFFSVRHLSNSNTYSPSIYSVQSVRRDVGTQYYLTLKLDL
jgi:iron complex outermembrane receptor protein